MPTLISGNKAMHGIYRAIIVEAKEKEASVYIPALHREQMPFKLDDEGKITGLVYKSSDTFEDESNGGYNEDASKNDSDSSNNKTIENNGIKLMMKLEDYPTAQLSAWIGRMPIKSGEAVWVSFENGDSEFPIIMGSLGSTLPLGDFTQVIGSGGKTNYQYGGSYNGQYYEGLPAYSELSESDIEILATWVTGECGGDDSTACKRIASQMANLNEVYYNRPATVANILDTVENGINGSHWYDPSSKTRGVTDTAKEAVRYCLKEGKRVLPRYVHTFCTFSSNWIVNYKEASQWQKGDDVTSNVAGIYMWKFFCFDRDDINSSSLNIMGYEQQFYDKYKNDDNKKVSVTFDGNTIIERAVNWAIQIANSKTIGYSQDLDKRWGPDYYDCSSFVISAFTNAGLDLKGNGASTTYNMTEVMVKMGFKDITSSVNLNNGNGLQSGDVVLNSGHTEMMISSTQLAGAHTNNSKVALADQVSVSNYYNGPWSKVLRYIGS